MGEKGIRLVNNKCGKVVVLGQQVWEPGQLAEQSIVYLSPTPQEAPVINKKPKLPDERWPLQIRTGMLGSGSSHLHWVTQLFQLGCKL